MTFLCSELQKYTFLTEYQTVNENLHTKQCLLIWHWKCIEIKKVHCKSVLF